MARPTMAGARFLLRHVLAMALAVAQVGAENPDQHIVASIQGELILGALIPVHERPEAKQAQMRICGPPREQYGIQRVEAVLRTIDLINQDPNILPNITLGIEIRDTCWHSPIALEQSIEFIRNAMAANDEINFSQLLEAPADSALALDKELVSTCSSLLQKSHKKLKHIVGVVGPASSQDSVQVQNLLQMFNVPQVGYSATSSELSEKNYFKYFLRVVPSDELQAQVMIDLMLAHNWTYVTVVYTEGSYGTNLMKAFRERAQANSICTATLESVPPNADDSKFDELIGALQKHQNAYVVVCMCEGRTVSRLFSGLKRHNLQNEFMVVGSDGWADRFDVVEDKESYAAGGISIRIHSAYVSDFDNYYFNLDPANNTRDPWFREFWEYRFQCQLAPLPDSNKTSSKSAPKSFFQPQTEALYSRNCTGNETLRLNYKQDTKMAFVQKAILTMAIGLDKLQRATCGEPKRGLCPEMLPLNGSQLIQHLMNVSFDYLGERVSFNEKGDPPGSYEILNFQALDFGEQQLGLDAELSWDSERTGSVAVDDPMYDSYKTLNAPSRSAEPSRRPKPVPPTGYWSKDRSTRYQYAHVGSWDSSNGLSLFGRFQWPQQKRAIVSPIVNGGELGGNKGVEGDESDRGQRQDVSDSNELRSANRTLEERLFGALRPVPRSVCSEQCPKGHAKQKIQSDSVKCCWICAACKPNEFLLDAYHCQPCEKGWWPTPDHSGCYRLPIKYMLWRSMDAMAAINVAVIGLFANAATLCVFLRYRNTPVVKSSSRELSYMILAAMSIVHAATFFLVTKPSVFKCTMTRVLPGFGYAMMYGALVTKTNRIARILAGSKKRIMTRRPMFMSTCAQLIIVWLIIMVEVGVIVFSLVHEPPDVLLEYPEEQRRINLHCNTTTTGTIVPLAFNFLLIIMCTWYAFKSRNVPQNFNEAKFIGFTMYTTLVLWTAFVVIYMSSAHKIITLCLCNSFSALLALVLLFFPRLYVILCKPEKNNRSYFITAKNLRCHIGHTAGSSGAAAAAEAAAELRQPFSRRLISSAATVAATDAAAAHRPPSTCNSLDLELGSLQAPATSPSPMSPPPPPAPPPLAPPSRVSHDLAASISDDDHRGPLAKLRALFALGRRRTQSKRALSIQQRIRAIRRAEDQDRQLRKPPAAQRLAHHFERPFSRRPPNEAPSGVRATHQDAQYLFELLRLLIGPRKMNWLLERLARLAQGDHMEPAARQAALALFVGIVGDAMANTSLEPANEPGVLCKSGPFCSAERAAPSCSRQDRADRCADEEDPIKRTLECILGQRRSRSPRRPYNVAADVDDDDDTDDDDDDDYDDTNGNLLGLTFISKPNAGWRSRTSLPDRHVGDRRAPILRSLRSSSVEPDTSHRTQETDTNSRNRQQQDSARATSLARQSIRPPVAKPTDNWTHHHGRAESPKGCSSSAAAANECNIMSSLDVIEATCSTNCPVANHSCTGRKSRESRHDTRQVARPGDKRRRKTVGDCPKLHPSALPSMKPANLFSSLPAALAKTQQRLPACRAQLLQLADGVESSADKTGDIAVAGDPFVPRRRLGFAGPQPERSSSLSHTCDMHQVVCPPNWTITPQTSLAQTETTSSTTAESSEETRV